MKAVSDLTIWKQEQHGLILQWYDLYHLAEIKKSTNESTMIQMKQKIHSDSCISLCKVGLNFVAFSNKASQPYHYADRAVRNHGLQS